MENVLVLFETDPGFRKELEAVLSGFKIIFNENGDTASIDAQTAENTAIIFGNPKPDFIQLCPRLKWLQLQSAGTNGYVNGEVNETVQLSCASGCYGHAVSEHMVALTVAMIKKLHLYRDEQAACRWQGRGTVKSIQDAVIISVGFGDLGRNYARRMKALGSYIIAVDRLSYTKPDYADELILLEQLDEVLPRADVVALTIPGTKDNTGFFGKSKLEKMRKDALLINAGRGTAVDTQALCEAMESGIIGGAALEVTDPEPLPSDHKLWKFENVLITPHVSGGRFLPQTYQYIMKLNLENARRFLRGETLESLVDYKTGICFPRDLSKG